MDDSNLVKRNQTILLHQTPKTHGTFRMAVQEQTHLRSDLPDSRRYVQHSAAVLRASA